MVDAEVHVIDRGGLYCDRNYLVEGATFATNTDHNPDTEYVRIPVWNLIIDHPAATILWDTGCHHAAAAGHWPEEFLAAFTPDAIHEHRLDDDLQAAGFAIDDIDVVIQSHLHVDHAGGLHWFDGTDVPIYVHERELKHAYYAIAANDGGSGYVREDFDHDLNWQILHDERETLVPDLECIHLPGHTPGLVGLLCHLEEPGSLLIAGDQFAVAANDEAGRPLGGPLLWGKTEWHESRRRVQALAREHDAAVVYGHDAMQFAAMQPGWGV